MPTWLFWTLAEVQERDRLKNRIDMYQAGGASASGFKHENAKALVDSWHNALQQPVLPIEKQSSKAAATKKRKPESEMTRAERIALWSGQM